MKNSISISSIGQSWLFYILFVLLLGMYSCQEKPSPPKEIPVHGLAINANGRFQVIETGTWRTIVEQSDTYIEVSRLDYHPNGQKLAMGTSYRGKIYEMETENYTETATLLDVTGVFAMAYSPDGNSLAVGASNKHEPTGTYRTHLYVLGENPVDTIIGDIFDIAFHPDGSEVAIAGHGGHYGLQIWTVGPEYVRKFNFNNIKAWASAYSKDGSKLFVGAISGLYTLDATNDYNEIEAIQLDTVRLVAIAPSGEWLAIARGTFKKTLEFYRVENGLTPMATYTLPYAAQAFAFSPESTLLAVGYREDSMRLDFYQAPDWKVVYTHKLEGISGISSMAFKPSSEEPEILTGN